MRVAACKSKVNFCVSLSTARGTPREIGSNAMVAEKNDFDRTRYSKTKFFHANKSMQKCVSS